jgi:PIN domain nuclease of toxin-antitoxin system
MSSILLDTHTFIWLSEDDPNLPTSLRTTIENTDQVLVSILLPISITDTIQLSQLPTHHKDPFDRILIAQAINRSLPIASRDVAFDVYNVQRLWA